MDQRKVMDGLMPRIAVGVASLLTVAIVLLAVFSQNGMLAVNTQQLQLDEILKSNEELRLLNERLEKQIIDFQTNPLMYEGVAREELYMARPDEYIIEVPDSDPAPTPSQ